jgi:16S rRNA (cytosine1402-N4)-methyltransferase
MEHDPALLGRVVEHLRPPLEDGGVVVDATLGRGGHARALLTAAPRAQLVGIDRDPDALEESRANLAAFSDRVRLVRDDFQEVAAVLERLGAAPVRGVLFDLGVSSPQLDDPRRGFGWRADGPLDMRMDPSQSVSAADIVNRYPAPRLERVIRSYGEERFAGRIAAAIARARPLESTGALAEVVRAAIPAAARRSGRHPARRTFMALRIEVNRELEALEVALPDAIESLTVGGRVAVISYHSLEDRIVKRTYVEQANGCVCPPDLPVCACGAEARVRILTRRPERPAAEEVERNPRARAAKLRVAERLATRVGGERA